VNYMKTFLFRIGVLLGLAVSQTAQAWDIYSNTNTASDLGWNYSVGASMVADEIVPVGGGYLNHIDIQYWAQNFTGGEQVRVWLFENTGTAITLGNRIAYEPGATPLYDSGFVTPTGFGNTSRSTINFDAGSDFLPDSILISGNYNLTLAIQFSGIDPGEDVGVSLYDWPSVGSGYSTFWTFDGSNWSLVSDNGAPTPAGGESGVGYVDFGMRIDVVPEPSSFTLVLLGGLALFHYRRRGAHTHK
jgi:hypothetical protein